MHSNSPFAAEILNTRFPNTELPLDWQSKYLQEKAFHKIDTSSCVFTSMNNDIFTDDIAGNPVQ